MDLIWDGLVEAIRILGSGGRVKSGADRKGRDGTWT